MTALSRVLAALARLVRKEPARVAAVCTVLLGWAAAAGVPAGVVGGVSTLLAAVLGIGLRAAVVPVAKVAETTAAAAREAATATAEVLTSETAGVAGVLSDTGRTVSNLAASGAAHTALKALGVPRKVRAKAVDK